MENISIKQNFILHFLTYSWKIQSFRMVLKGFQRKIVHSYEKGVCKNILTEILFANFLGGVIFSYIFQGKYRIVPHNLYLNYQL